MVCLASRCNRPSLATSYPSRVAVFLQLCEQTTASTATATSQDINFLPEGRGEVYALIRLFECLSATSDSLLAPH